MDWEKTRMLKKWNFKQGIVIAKKSQQTRRDCWGGNVNHKSNPYFGSIKMLTDNWVKIGICGLHCHPSNPFLFVSFFLQSLFLVQKFHFFLTFLSPVALWSGIYHDIPKHIMTWYILGYTSGYIMHDIFLTTVYTRLIALMRANSLLSWSAG